MNSRWQSSPESVKDNGAPRISGPDWPKTVVHPLFLSDEEAGLLSRVDFELPNIPYENEKAG